MKTPNSSAVVSGPAKAIPENPVVNSGTKPMTPISRKTQDTAAKPCCTAVVRRRSASHQWCPVADIGRVFMTLLLSSNASRRRTPNRAPNASPSPRIAVAGGSFGALGVAASVRRSAHRRPGSG
nr:hypothetical protein GCM10025732_31470 [Glycomyces mayteni]